MLWFRFLSCVIIYVFFLIYFFRRHQGRNKTEEGKEVMVYIDYMINTYLPPSYLLFVSLPLFPPLHPPLSLPLSLLLSLLSLPLSPLSLPLSILLSSLSPSLSLSPPFPFPSPFFPTLTVPSPQFYPVLDQLMAVLTNISFHLNLLVRATSHESSTLLWTVYRYAHVPLSRQLLLWLHAKYNI